LRLIEPAITITQFNAGFKRDHSFEYYISEIENLLAAKMISEKPDTVLSNKRRNWQNIKELRN
jgi:hypothetical protein